MFYLMTGSPSYLRYKQETMIIFFCYETDVTVRLGFNRRQALKRNGSELR